ncbi:MAG TPA: lamin tail domain-containing protein [bacterium]|nr:lamin tail domain-containing protein [bacterium]
MLTTTLLNALALLPQGGNGQGTSTAPVVINEFNYDDSGADNFEFVELYNRSSAPVDLSGWSLVGDDSNGVNFTETFPAGTILAPGDFLVLGDAGVPNVDIIRASGFLQNSNESITLFDASSNIVDTLIYEANKGVFNPLLAEGEGIWGNFVMIEGNETTWSRFRDGFDTDNNGYDFRLQPWSPGASNDLPYVPAMAEVLDGYTVGSDVPAWGSSFVNPVVIDPAVVDANNPSSIPASPQGGLAAVTWDPTGGGNHVMSLTDAGRNTMVEMYVYIDATPLQVGDLEMWSVGFGTSGTFYNLPDPTGTLGFAANGDTGLCWTFVRDDTGATIYLMDRNDGAMGANALTAPVVVGSVPIQAGVNDGWQRLLIDINGTSADARFGGTYGVADGTLFSTTVDDVDRGLYVGYREAIAIGTTGARPFTFDLLTLNVEGSARAVPYGSGCENLTLSSTGAPALGNNTFSLDVNNVTVVPIAFVGFGTSVVNPGLDLTAIGMPGCFGYTSLDVGLFGTGPVVNGTGSLVVPIANSTALIGATLAAQGITFSNTTALGLAASNGVEIFVGN